MMKLILASLSPRRADLLRSIQLEFIVYPSAELDEQAVLDNAEGSLSDRLMTLAEAKGTEAAKIHLEDIVLSADTVVAIGNDAMGKPSDRDHSIEMLTRLSGRAHHVHTAVCVQCLATGFKETAVETTRVTFALLDRYTIEQYVDRAKPFDKAGSYAIQDLGALLVRKIEGDYSNVVGLPLPLSARLLTNAGLRVI